MTKYHEAAHTLDPNVEIPDADEVAPAAGHDEEMTDKVREAQAEFAEAVKAEADAQEQAEQEWAERDPKPTPSEFAQEFGREPAPDDASASQGGDTDATDDSEVPDGTTQDVLDWVGDDPARAQQALEAEQAKPTPRTTLIAELEKRTENTA